MRGSRFLRRDWLCIFVCLIVYGLPFLFVFAFFWFCILMYFYWNHGTFEKHYSLRIQGCWDDM